MVAVVASVEPAASRRCLLEAESTLPDVSELFQYGLGNASTFNTSKEFKVCISTGHRL